MILQRLWEEALSSSEKLFTESSQVSLHRARNLQSQAQAFMEHMVENCCHVLQLGVLDSRNALSVAD